MSPRGKQSLRSKLLAITASILLPMSVVTLTAVAGLNYASERERLQDVEEQIRRSIWSKGATLTQSHALALKGLASDNAFSDVRQLVHGAAREEDVVYGAFISADGQAWAYVTPSSAETESVVPHAWRELSIPDRLFQKSAYQRRVQYRGREVREFGAAVRDEEGTLLGTVVYGLSTERMTRAVSAARARSRRALLGTLAAIAALGLFSVALGVLLMRRAALRITQPIIGLTAAANRIAEGARGIRVTADSNDEVEVLARAFNHMLEANEDALARLELSTQRALEADRLKGEFLANMSHEIRTPMNGVLGMVSLMQTHPLDPKLRRYVQTIDASAQALLTIVNDILDFSKLQAGKYTIEAASFAPRVLLQETCDLLAIQAHRKGIELVYRTDPALPSHAIGDPARIRQVLTNLIGNAIKFTSAGHVFVNWTALQAEGDELVLQVAVEDTGCGIDDADVGKLFGMFAQLDGSSVRRHGGTGLGLAISKRLAQMMGGDIAVRSRLGKGSVFTFTAKLVRDARAEGASPRRLDPAPRVLVVEDSLWRDVLVEQLRGWGCECEGVDGESAAMARLEQAQTSDAPFHIVLAGADLEGVSEPDWLVSLTEEPAFHGLRRVLLSRSRADTDAVDTSDHGVEHLYKPIRSEDLYACLCSCVSNSRVRAASQRPPGSARQDTVLVVDDNEINRYVASEQLEHLGYRVELAANGREACERLQSPGIAAVLMDCQMPVMDGYTAARKIREAEARAGTRRLPIIALTAHAFAGERQRVLDAGMDDYVTKPCHPPTLQKLLAQYVQDRDDSFSPLGSAGRRPTRDSTPAPPVVPQP